MTQNQFFLKKKTCRSKFFGKLLGNLSFTQPQATVAKKGLLREAGQKKIARSKRPICDEGIDRADDFWKIDESSLKRRHVLHHLLLALWRPGSHRELPDVLFVNVCDVQKDTHSYI